MSLQTLGDLRTFLFSQRVAKLPDDTVLGCNVLMDDRASYMRSEIDIQQSIISPEGRTVRVSPAFVEILVRHDRDRRSFFIP